MKMNSAVEPLLLKAEEVAALMAISTRTLWRLVSVDSFPQPVRIGGSVRWRKSEIENWIASGCPRETDDQQ